jgi:CRP-like cAMP-binding protein
MAMSRLFEQYIEKQIPGITAAQVQRICAGCVFKKLRKKETVLREGEVSNHKIFVTTGLLRNFGIGGNGSEHILRFSDAGSWTADPESYFSGKPSKYNIDAIEPSEIAILSHDELETLVRTIPALDVYFRRMVTTNMGRVQQRVLDAISASPEEKYRGFMKDYPGVFQRVPLHMVASYLRVSRETLTRVRQGLAAAVRA